MAATDRAAAAFAELQASIRREVTDPAAAGAVCARLQRFWDSPPCSALEWVLRRGVGPESARALLFAPGGLEDGMSLYPLLLRSAPPDAPASHPARALQVPFLSLLPSHVLDWRLAAAFVAHGGMGALAALLLEPSFPLRVQAIEVLLQITSHKGFAWFEAPAESDETAKRLHAAVLALAQPAGEPGGGAAAVPFIAALLANWDNPLPGASFNCLQLLAWWLSWVRLLHTGGLQTLRLSRPLLNGLRAWAERPVAPEGGADAAAAAGGGGSGGALPLRYSLPEEAALARKVFDDFSRYPAEEEEEGGGGTRAAPAKSAAARGGVAGISPAAAALPPPLPSSPAALRGAVGALREDGAASGESALAPANSAAAAKEEGNAHFRGERWGEAAAAYGRGIAQLAGGGGGAPAPATRELLLALLSNRAYARLRASGYGAGVAPSSGVLQAVERALRLGGGDGGGGARALASLRAAADAVAAAAGCAGEDEGAAPAASGGAAPTALLGTQPVRGVFGCLVDCARALALDGGHVKCLFRRAQALLALRAAGEALRAARECIARCRERGASAGDLLAQANTLVSFGAALQSSGEGEEEGEVGGGARRPAGERAARAGPLPPAECSDEDAVLAALLQRAEFGGGGGGGGGGAPLPQAAPQRQQPEGQQPPQPPPQQQLSAEAPHAASAAAAAAPVSAPPRAGGPPNVEDVLAGRAASSLEDVLAGRAASTVRAGVPPNVEDVLAGRAASKVAKKVAPAKSFSLPPP
jgi:hypothetical protein